MSLPLDAEADRAPTRIEPVDPYLEAFVAAGADVVIVHAEACPHLDRTLSAIHDLGARAGVALNPATHESALAYVLNHLDLVLVMSVNPGFGEQRFILTVIERDPPGSRSSRRPADRHRGRRRHHPGKRAIGRRRRRPRPRGRLGHLRRTPRGADLRDPL